MREKLIEILRAPIFVHELADPTEAVADYLLGNGVAPVVHGRWLDVCEDMDLLKCSLCGSVNHDRYHYCPYCGARMEVGNNGKT